MIKKRKRLYGLLLILFGISFAVYFLIKALENKMVFFYSPSDLAILDNLPLQKIRVGGMVLENSLVYQDLNSKISFKVTDYKNNTLIIYEGILPDLFREGQGIIAEGFIESSKIFYADRVLAKHDENYMPPEISKSLKNNNLMNGSE